MLKAGTKTTGFAVEIAFERIRGDHFFEKRIFFKIKPVNYHNVCT
jgi:hypothetical protein